MKIIHVKATHVASKINAISENFVRGIQSLYMKNYAFNRDSSKKTISHASKRFPLHV